MAVRKRVTLNKPVPARRAPTPRGVLPATGGGVERGQQAALAPALNLEPLRYIQDLIRDVPDFPRPGILFRDITPLLGDPRGFALVVDALSSRFVGEPLDAVAGIEARGFIFGAALAQRLNLSFVPIRKPGKLPASVDRISYSLEYGDAELEVHKDAFKRGARVLVVDDLLATGGTASAAGELVRRRGATVVAYLFVVELKGLSGRAALKPSPIFSLLQYE